MTDYLHLDTDDNLRIQPGDLVGKMIGVMGSTGSGKSYTLAVLVEELHPHMSFTIVDTAGEYYTLRERYDLLIAGRFNTNEEGERIDHCDLEISVEDAETIAEYSFRHRVSIILDLALFDEDERANLLAAYFKHLWSLAVRKRQPYAVIVDEAQNYIPQNSKTAVKRHMVRLAKEGRKCGISFVFATQRPASITKDVITQASMLFLHAVYYATDVDTYCTIVPKLKPAAVEALIDQLQTGQAIFIQGKDSQIVRMRARYTTHAGSTPELNGDHHAALRIIDEKTVEELKAHLVPAVEASDSNAKDAAQRDMVTQLQREKVAQDKQITDLRTEVQKWKELAQGRSLSDALPEAVMQLRMDHDELPAGLAAKASKRASASQTRVVKRQVDSLKRLKVKIQRLPNYEKEVLFFLAHRPEKWFTRETITRTLAFSLSHLSMQKLTDTGLVARDRRSRIHQFSFRDDVLKEMFPDLDQAYVLDQVIPGVEEKTA